MPHQTFFNLPNDKRQTIIDAAINEFAEYPLSQARVARIVERSGIPRGSFYQYFVDVQDAYKYVFTLVGEKKMDYISREMPDLTHKDVFATIKQLYRVGIQFTEENPKLSAIGRNFVNESSSVKAEIMGGLADRSREFFGHLLAKAKAAGEIRQDVSIDTVSFMLYQLNLALVDRLLASIDQHGVEEIDWFYDSVDQVIDILKNGIRGR